MHTNAQTTRLLVIATLLLPMFLSMPAPAQQEKKASIITYPVPDLAACTNLKRSVAYTLRVGASVADTEVFVYALSGFGKDGKPGNDGVGVAFSAFAFSGGPVKIELTSISTNAIKSAEVWPLEFGIKPTVDGQKVSFTLTEPRKVMVVLNGGPCLSLFADPPETDVPTAQTPGVIYYGPGVHELGRNYVEIPSKTTVYLAPGAIVKGCFQAGGSSNKTSDVTIKGRGMIFRGDLPWKQDDNLSIKTGPNFVERLTIQDIMLIGGPFWIEYVGGHQLTLRNQKIISPYVFNSDGIGLTCATDALVEGNYIFNLDDALISQYSSNVRFVNNVTFNSGNGNAIYLCYGWLNSEHNIRVEDLYCLGAPGSAAISITHPGSDELTGLIFKNIYAHNCRFAIRRVSDYIKASDMGGGFSDLYFENVRFYNLSNMKSMLDGRNAETPIQYVTFNGLYRDNAKVGSLAEINVETKHVTNVVFDAPHVMITEPYTTASLLEGDAMTLRAEALGFTSAVDRVEFYIDGVLAGSARAAPYEYVWKSMRAGTHNLRARACVGNRYTESRGNLYVDVKPSIYDLVSNGGFEAGKAFWQACYGGTLEEETKIVRTGRKALKISGRTSTAHVPIQRLSALTPVPLPPVPASARKAASSATPEKNLALGKPCNSPNAPYATNMVAANLVDGDAGTVWVAKEYGNVMSNVWAEVEFGAPTTFNKVRLGPDYGDRIAGFRIDYYDGDAWKTACMGGAAREDGYYEAYVRNASTTSMARLVFQSGRFNIDYTRSYGDWRAVGTNGWARLRVGTAGITVHGDGDVEVYVENNHATETFYVDDVKGVRCYETQPATVVFPAVTGTKARLYITSASGPPAPYEMGIYLEPEPDGGE